jgi:methanogenic corrinoid protein MtbC1
MPGRFRAGALRVMRSDSDDASDEGISISEVSRLLGVAVATLRSWEIRYGIPQIDRDSGRHRRYNPDQLTALRLMRDQIGQGQRAGVAARHVRSELGLTSVAKPLVDLVLASSAAMDPHGVRDSLTVATERLGLASCIDDVLMPAMRQIGVWWQAGTYELEQEHLTSEAVRGWLNAASARAPRPHREQQIILACGPADLHTVGIEALAVLLRYQNRACRVLGARVPTATLLTAVRGTGTEAVVVASHLGAARMRAADSIREVDQAGTPVFYAGQAFAQPRHRAGLPGYYLGANLQHACILIEERLEAK